jgi:hypothetical protein
MPKISQLPTLTNITTGSIIPVVESSLTQKLTVGKLFEFLSGALDQTFTTEVELMLSASSLVTTSSFNSFSSSVNNTTHSLNNSTASLNTFSSSVNTTTASLNSKTGSYATTGSNTFIGNQTITGSLNVSGTLSIGGDVSAQSSETIGNFIEQGIFVNKKTEAFQYSSYNGGPQLSLDIEYQKPLTTGSGINTLAIGFADLTVQTTAFVPTTLVTTSSFNSYTASVVSVNTSSLVTTSSFNSYTASVVSVNTGSFATTGSNQFNGNQSVTGSLIVSGGFEVKNSGYSWSFESNGRTKIPNITFNSDRGTGMVGIKPAIGREFQIETSTEVSSAGPWVFGLDGTLSAPSGANITRVANLITTSSFNTFTSSVNSTTQSLNNFTASVVATGSNINSFTASVNEKTGSFATTGSNQFNGNQTITGSLIHGLEGNLATGDQSHAEGSVTKAIGNYSHAEGDFTQAKGDYSHAEGQETIASGSYSHAEGYQTIALANHQHVQGQFNATSSVLAAFIVGNGTDDSNRSNLIHAAGNTVEITGSLSVSGSLMISGSGSLNGSNIVSSNTIQKIETISSASYAALTPPVSGTLYIII